METYEFEHIVGHACRLFRLFKLRAGSGDDEIAGEIKSYRLRYGQGSHSDSDVPDPEPYDALSYHWGLRDPDHDPLIRIVQQGSKTSRIQVTQSLFSALKALRHRAESRYLWIDALCINQKNAAEKNLQISYMSTIYNQAEYVRVWLGEHDDYVPVAFEFIHRCLNAEVLDKMMEDPNASKSWDALSSLMRKPWFSRRWIVQEIALARSATLHCGEAFVDWEEFADVVSQLTEKQDKLRELFIKSSDFKNHPDYLGDISELGAIRLVDATEEFFHKSADGRIQERKLTLEEIICSTSAFEASDPHDVIYAVLSLANDAHGFSAFVEEENSTPSLLSPLLPTNGAGVGFSEERTSNMTNGSSFGKRPYAGDQPESSRPSKRVIGPEVTGPPTIELTSPVTVTDSFNVMPETNGVPGDGQYSPYQQDPDVSPGGAVTLSVSGMERSISHSPINSANGLQRAQMVWNTLRAPENSRLRSVSDAVNPKERTLAAIMKWKRSAQKSRFRLNYQLSIFQVCKELLVFTIERSRSLDILCRPWAPDDFNDLEFPSWICPKSKVAFEANDLGVYRRVNADPLLGKPGPGGTAYKAGRSRNLVYHVFNERSLTVRGFVLDQIEQHDIMRNATSGTVPSDWKRAANWNDQSLPPNEFWRTLVGDRMMTGKRAPKYWRRACHDAFRRGSRNQNLETHSEVMHDLPNSTREFVQRLRSVIWDRKLVRMSKASTGLSFGLVPRGVKGGDLVCIIYGCNVPVILRQIEKDGKTFYRLIGESYVHGAMDGEASEIRAKILQDSKAARRGEGGHITEEFDQLFELR